MALRWSKLLPSRPQHPVETPPPPVPVHRAPALPLNGLQAGLDAWAETAALAAVADSRIDQTLSDVSFGSRDLAGSIEKVSAAATQLQASVSDIAVGMEQQSESLGRATTHAGNVAEEAARAAAEAERLAQAMREAAASAREGAGAVNSTVSLLGQAREAVTRSAEPMGDLMKLSQEISRILSSVLQIANRTNLLALNAAIEAARAGEHGRGFSVVADEIRKLADSSSQSARQVGELVRRVESETLRATGLVNAGAARVDEITRTVETAVRDLEGVLQNTAAMESAVEAISGSVAGVGRSSRSLAEAIAGAAAVSEETTGQAELIAASARDVAQVMHGAADLAVYFGDVQNRIDRVLAPVRESMSRGGRVLTQVAEMLPAEAAQAAGPVELLWGDWITWKESDAWFGLERFMQANSGIKLKLVPAQVELDAFLSDLRIPDVTWAAVNVASQIFEPIDDRLRQAQVDLSEYMPGLVETIRRIGGGKLFGLPVHVDMPVMLYSPALFDRAGVPYPRAGMTWPDLIRSLQQVSRATGAHGLDIHWSHGFDSFCQHFLSPVGCQLMDDRGQRLQISAQLREQFQFLWDMQHRHKVLAPSVRQAYEYDTAYISRGQVAAVLTISPMIGAFRQVWQRTGHAYEIAPFPSFPSHVGMAPCLSFLVVGMSRFSRHKEEAWQFLRHLVSDPQIYAENCREGRNLSGRMTPAIRAVYEEYGRKNPPANYQALWSQRHAPSPLYLFAPGFRRVATIGWQQVQQLLSGQKSADEAVQTLQEFARLLEH